MRQPPSPPQPPASGSRDYQVKIGTNGISVTEPGDAATQALQAQAQVLKARIATLSSEIETVKSRGTPMSMATDQIRLTSLESRRTDAEEALEKIEDQLALKGSTPSTVTEIGVPSPPLVPFDPNSAALQENVTVIAVSAIVFIGAPIAIAIARFIWKRTLTRSAPAATPSADDARRLERVEQAVESIAVEMERMSEGQRYVTKLLSERAGAPVAAPIVQGAPAEVRR